MKLLFKALLCAAMLCAAQAAFAQSYPSRPMHLIVAYSARRHRRRRRRGLLSDKLAAVLGQSIVVENRAGASGAIGARTVATATPDGYTLLLGQTGEISINQHWLKDIGYDPDKDLQPIALASVVPLALVVPAKAPYSTMQDYLGLPEIRQAVQLRLGRHRHARLFRRRAAQAGRQGQYDARALQGRRPRAQRSDRRPRRYVFPRLSGGDAAVKAGTLKLLAVSSGTRAPSAPDVPTVAEATGIKNFDFTLWQGIFAPHGTPDAIVSGSTPRSTRSWRATRSRKNSPSSAPRSGRCRSLSSLRSCRPKAPNTSASSRIPAPRPE